LSIIVVKLQCHLFISGGEREDRNIRQMRLKAGPTALFPRKALIVGILNQNIPEADKLVDRYFRKWSRGLLSS
jgi:hypothetical protein